MGKRLDFCLCLREDLFGDFTSAFNELFYSLGFRLRKLGVDLLIKAVKLTASDMADILTGKTASFFQLVFDILVNIFFYFITACLGVRIYYLTEAFGFC